MSTLDTAIQAVEIERSMRVTAERKAQIAEQRAGRGEAERDHLRALLTRVQTTLAESTTLVDGAA